MTLMATATRPARRLRHLTREDLSILLGAVLLACGLLRSWVRPALGEARSVWDLPIPFPFLHSFTAAPWALLPLAALATLIAGRIRRTNLLSTSAALALAGTLGFVVCGSVSDTRLQVSLRRSSDDLLSLQRLIGYQVPRPRIQTLGPIPLPQSAADLLSSLRGGFYLSLAGAAVLTITAVRRHRQVREISSPSRWVAVAVAVVLIAGLGERAGSIWASGRARASAATGQDADANQRYRLASRLNPALADNADAAARYGTSLLRAGTVSDLNAELASSRLQLAAGHDLQALQTLSAACARWPRATVVRTEFAAQAMQYLRLHDDPAPVRRLAPVGPDLAILRIALAKAEVRASDYPTAISDARSAAVDAQDEDMRSVALTYWAVAQIRSGDAVGGRRTLLAAAAADSDNLNVVARALLTGLYIPVQI